MGEELYSAVTQFLKLFPELQSVPLFLAGESYAGKLFMYLTQCVFVVIIIIIIINYFYHPHILNVD